LIANPASGRGAAPAAMKAAAARLESLGHAVTTHTTERPGHATELTAAAVAAGYEVVAAVGGDGTVNEVATALLGTSVDLAVIPAGTGNDLVRALGLPRTPEAAAETAAQGSSQMLDVWSLNGRPFLNVACVGLDAAVAATLASTGRRFGGAADYIVALAATLRRFRPLSLTVEVDHHFYAGAVMLAAIANTSSYGGGMRIAPEADPHDELLEVILVEAMPKWRLVSKFPRVFRGTHVTDPQVRCLRGGRVRIDGDRSAAVMVDGEVYGALPLVIEPWPHRLRVRVPAGGDAPMTQPPG
jgi:diacylglycerol kinase (ATP)